MIVMQITTQRSGGNWRNQVVYLICFPPLQVALLTHHYCLQALRNKPRKHRFPRARAARESNHSSHWAMVSTINHCSSQVMCWTHFHRTVWTTCKNLDRQCCELWPWTETQRPPMAKVWGTARHDRLAGHSAILIWKLQTIWKILETWLVGALTKWPTVVSIRTDKKPWPSGQGDNADEPETKENHTAHATHSTRNTTGMQPAKDLKREKCLFLRSGRRHSCFWFASWALTLK